MPFSFDLISDLHVETWDSFDWEGQATSPFCIVAGDVGRDRNVVLETLAHLGKCYQGVFYIDGNDEHRHYIEDLGSSYRDLTRGISRLKNVVYLQDNVVIINGVAILATNGWWTYDFDPSIDQDKTIEWYQHYVNASESSAAGITGVAYHDAAYMINSVSKLQTHQEVKAIVLVSHTVPAPWIVSHDIDLADSWRFNCMGNSHLAQAIEEDTENKIKTWCFGHYHKPVDQQLHGINYVSNPRGRGDTPWCQPAYYPRRITVTY